MGAAAIPYVLAAVEVGSLGLSAYQTFRGAPEIKIPTIKIPTEDLTKINQAIEANKALSDRARTAINQAITNYNEGKLTPQYQAKLDEWWKEASKRLNERLSAAGLERSSVADSAFNELTLKYQSMAADLLRTQLSDALSLAGLSQEYINELIAKTKLEVGAQAAYAESYAQAWGPAQQAAAEKGKAFAGLTESFTKLPETLEKLGIEVTKPTTQVTGTEPLVR